MRLFRNEIIGLTIKEKIVSNILFISILLLVSCTKPSNKTDISISNNHTKINSLKDTTITFLWRENRYDEKLKGTYNFIVINENYCKTISEPEKAALAYVATFIGNECWWENDEPNADRTNLKCKILSALDLGCQGSEQHLSFLRNWFKNDKKCLKELENIPSTPYTSTIQDTFDKINITVKGNTIKVWYKASEINSRDDLSWEWTETDYFKVDKDNLQLVKVDKSKNRAIK